jgi:D-xylonolactonase
VSGRIPRPATTPRARVAKAERKANAYHFEISEGFSDGMCSDKDGNLWIALRGGWGVVCHDSKTGERIAKIELPVEAVTSCCFDDKGGLFITTASLDLDAKGHELQPLAGSFFHAETSSSAQPDTSFG